MNVTNFNTSHRPRQRSDTPPAIPACVLAAIAACAVAHPDRAGAALPLMPEGAFRRAIEELVVTEDAGVALRWLEEDEDDAAADTLAWLSQAPRAVVDDGRELLATLAKPPVAMLRAS